MQDFHAKMRSYLYVIFNRISHLIKKKEVGILKQLDFKFNEKRY